MCSLVWGALISLHYLPRYRPIEAKALTLMNDAG